MTENKRFGKFLKECRRKMTPWGKHGASQEDICACVGLRQSALSRIEAGITPATHELVVKLSSILGFSTMFALYEEYHLWSTGKDRYGQKVGRPVAYE